MKCYLFLSALIIILLAGCNDQSKTNSATISRNLSELAVDSSKESNKKTPFYYDLQKPNRTWELPSSLKEVSGNAWVNKNQLLLINDNFPALYLFTIGDEKLVLDKTIPFKNSVKGKADIEGVTMIRDIVYTLGSDGRVFKITGWRSTPSIKTISTFLTAENNTEGLCYDPATDHLLIACKEASGINGGDEYTRAVYQFDLVTEKVNEEPFLIIHKKDFVKLAEKEIDFYPSAIAVHPVTQNIYLLSTRENKCMAVYNRAGVLLSFQWIDAKLIPQPEGICFSPEGVLYISTEGKKGRGKLLKFESQ